MRRNNVGFGLNGMLVIVAVLFVIAAIAIPTYLTKATPDIELRGWVRSVNVINYTTYISLEKEDDITPRPYELVGIHSELWRGEHVWLKLHPRPIGRYDVVDFRRLGPDANGQLPNSP